MDKLTVRELVLYAVLGALTFAAKFVMSFLPNIEPVSLFVMLFAVVFGKKWIYPVYLYVALEILFYGISLWNVNYLYIWAVLAIAAYFLRCIQSRLGWAMLSGVFGLLFGALCGIVDVFVGGLSYAVSKWISRRFFLCTDPMGVGNSLRYCPLCRKLHPCPAAVSAHAAAFGEVVPKNMKITHLPLANG